MNANQDHAPLLTAEDLHAMTDDALREIIRLCASQSRIYRAAPVYLPWYRLGAQALAELDDRAFEDKLIFEQERDLKAEAEEHAHEYSPEDSVEEEEDFCARAKAAHEAWEKEEERRAKIEASREAWEKFEAVHRAARKSPLGPEIKF